MSNDTSLESEVVVPNSQHGKAQTAISIELAKYQSHRSQRYQAVNVLLISWADDDLGCGAEIEELGRMFREVFCYAVWPYRIPSLDSQRILGVTVARFIEAYGGEDKLIIAYYGGHGGMNLSSKSPCTWAALIEGGPTVDWSIVQPLFFGAGCDVAIILDCCYAGQAARSYTTQSIEFLAATDKDQMTPSGSERWPSFTKVLIREMNEMLKEEVHVNLPGLQQRMVTHGGLRRQPFYVPLGGSGSAGSIKLLKLQQPEEGSSGKMRISSSTPLSIQLSLFSPLDLGTAGALIKWMTKDSPSHIANIQLADQILSDAADANALGEEVVHHQAQAEGQILPFLSNEGRTEAARLLNALRTALSRPSSSNLVDEEATSIIHDVRQKSLDLITFVSDSLSHLGTSPLEKMKSMNSFSISDLRDRIAMRLTLIGEDVSASDVRVRFDNRCGPQQRLREGKRNGLPVLVEYYYPQDVDDKSWKALSRQAARISTMQSEPKTEKFRILPGFGFLSERLHKPRLGFIYKLPENKTGCDCLFLSDLLDQVTAVPLDVRARTASAVCDAVIHLHSIGWYHKAIKSANILIFESAPALASEGERKDTHTRWDFANPYIFGFDCSRPVEAETRGTVDFSIKNNIYRHPERWGWSARFERYHDLYALGILLLEIACWKSFPSMDSERSNFDHVQDPEKLYNFLLRVTEEKVSHAAGTDYAEGVRSCLKSKDWRSYEDWQFQRLARDKVLRPLRALFKD